MGIIPSLIMVIFNVLVVRAVNEANKRRARMTRRQQRNITVTSMLVSQFLAYKPTFPSLLSFRFGKYTRSPLFLKDRVSLLSSCNIIHTRISE